MKEYILEWDREGTGNLLITSDPQELVRCKDCKHFQMHERSDFHKRMWPEDGDHWYECLHHNDDGEHGTRTRGPDWFCADGVRQTE